MSTLTPVQTALEKILDTVDTPLPAQQVALSDALGRVLAEDVKADSDVPGADNSAMDGYALRSAEAGQALRVVQRIPAGVVGAPVESGTAARIFTGAILPVGADSVAMQENCVEEAGILRLNKPVDAGENVRPRGQDIARGEQVLPRGRRLRPQDLGLLASLGRAQLDVYRPLKVAILSTGDELVEPGQGPLAQGQLYNSNRFTLRGLLQSMGMECLDFGIVADNPQDTADTLQRAADTADCVISSGGVSVGEEDHVKAQVERLGHLTLWKLAIKPGKPLAFGHIAGTPFFGLPGNPTSVFVTFSLVARPWLLAKQGMDEIAPPRLFAAAGFEVARGGTRQDYLRVLVSSENGVLRASRFPNQSSGVLSSVSYSNALAVIPPGVKVARGDAVEIILLDGLY